MRRLMLLIAPLLIALLVWSGSSAHAGEAFIGEVSAEAPGHYAGDRDEVPADPDKATPHHHGICHGHCVGIPADQGIANPFVAVDMPAASHLRHVLIGTVPARMLRPPIA